MYVPRVRSGFVVPRWLFTALAFVCAVITAFLLASLFTRSTSDDFALDPVAVEPPTQPGSLAYAVTEGNRDVIYVRDVEGIQPARRIASFFVPLSQNHARGATSPNGDRIAVLHLTGASAEASLSIVEIPAEPAAAEAPDRAEPHHVGDGFNYLSRLAWAPDGSHLALTRKASEGDTSDAATSYELVEVDPFNFEAAAVHTFTDALEVAPVGYTPDGRLLSVVVDKAGSSLWSHGDGESVLLTTFSPGLTVDWSLSPGADRLAFVEHLGAGERSRVGRVLMIATGRVTDALDSGNQVGAVWQPGAPLPDFGGPGGTVTLSGPEEGSYLIPLAWTPDKRYLITTVVESEGTEDNAVESVQIVSGDGRVRLAEGRRVRFLGLLPGD